MKYKLDTNHNDLVKVYRDLGCSVSELSRYGYTIDLLVGCVGITELVEIKTETGTLTPAQEDFMKLWRGRKPKIVTTQDEVIAHVCEMRARHKNASDSS